LALAWDALLKWVVHQFDLLGQGASVPHFLRVTWRGSEYEAARSARGAPPSAASTSRAPTVLAPPPPSPVEPFAPPAPAAGARPRGAAKALTGLAAQVHERRPHAALSEAFLERFALKARRVPDLPEARCEEVCRPAAALPPRRARRPGRVVCTICRAPLCCWVRGIRWVRKARGVEGR